VNSCWQIAGHQAHGARRSPAALLDHYDEEQTIAWFMDARTKAAEAYTCSSPVIIFLVSFCSNRIVTVGKNFPSA
jgi:hypothetical protein